MYENSEISYHAILDEIPKSTNWIRGALPQFETFANRNCLLFLGFCPQYAGATPGEGIATLDPKEKAPFTELFLGAAARALKTDAVNLCIRKECRKTQIQVTCRPISPEEAVQLFFATKLEIAIAQKEFGINFTTCIAFSEPAQDIARALPLPGLRIMDPSHLALSGSWPLVTLGLRHTADQLSEADGTDPGKLYTNIRADLTRACPKWAHIKPYDGDPAKSYIPNARMSRIRRTEQAAGIDMVRDLSIDELGDCSSEDEDLTDDEEVFVPDST